MSADGRFSPPGVEAMAGLYPLVDDAWVRPERFPAVATALVRAGCTIVQLRVKRLDDRDRVALQREVAMALEGSSVALCVNDRADLAAILAEEAPAGLRVVLHLGQTDLPPAAARRIVGDEVLVGLSTHDLDQVRAAAAEPVDYLGFGPVFATASKETPDPVVGLEGLREAVRVAGRPVVAIGGIDVARAPEAWKAGARAVAVIGALYAGLERFDEADLSTLEKRARALQDARP
ncbi:MAG: thiamine phosphate synthase [Myxococcota bacterium]